MTDWLEWSRPLWFLALPAGGVLLWAWWRAQAGRRLWHRLVDAELLEHLAGAAQASSARLALVIAATALVLAVCALAGPVWRTQANAPQRDAQARIVVLDLSPSMDAIDVVPSRLRRAREATAALLRDAAGARLGLVVFGGDAFSVAPLTSDAATLVHLLAGAKTTTVPRVGSRPDLGLEMALALAKQAGVAGGEVILVGDSAGDARTLDAARALARARLPVSVLAVGTAHGGPIPAGHGAFARTEAGEIRIVKTDFSALEQVAEAGRGRFEVLRAAGEPPNFARGRPKAPEPVQAVLRAMPEPARDGGAWFALLALPLAALLFRRGWLAGLAALAFLPALSPPQAQAFDWDSLWRRTDQQAAAAFARAKPSDTARVLGRLGLDSPWHPMLLYRSGNFAEAAAQFATGDTAVAHYNRGNALALDGDLEGAIAAYDAAIARRPGMQDAHFNRAMVRKALAARSMDPQGGEPGSKREQKSSSAGGRSRGPARERPEASGATGRRQPIDEFGNLPQLPPADARERAREEEASKGADGLTPEERERLEALLSKVPDDPGALLQSRFAEHLRSRGTPHPDVGARW